MDHHCQNSFRPDSLQNEIMLPSPEYQLQDLAALSRAEEYGNQYVLFPVRCEMEFYVDFTEKTMEVQQMLSEHPKLGDQRRLRRIKYVPVDHLSSIEEIILTLTAQD